MLFCLFYYISFSSSFFPPFLTLLGSADLRRVPDHIPSLASPLCCSLQHAGPSNTYYTNKSRKNGDGLKIGERKVEEEEEEEKKEVVRSGGRRRSSPSKRERERGENIKLIFSSAWLAAMGHRVSFTIGMKNQVVEKRRRRRRKEGPNDGL